MGKRKKQKNHPQKKDVHEFVHFRSNHSQINVSWDDQGRLVCPEADPESVCIYKGYLRDSGKEKIVSRTFASDGKVHFLEQNHILSNFDSLAAIDTNNYYFHGRKLAISAPYYCLDLKRAPQEQTTAISLPFFIIENVLPGINPETIGWHLFIKHLIPILPLEKSSKLALIVDSELGKLESINNRKSSYYGSHFLPPNMNLIYASADTGDSPTNKLIKECDKASKRYFSMIQEGKINLPAQLGAKSVEYSGYAYVNHEESDFKI